MGPNSPLDDLSRALGHAEHVGFPDLQEEVTDYRSPPDVRTGKRPVKMRTRRPYGNEIMLASMFPQTWGSTALGFGGIGGASITTAYTVVLSCPRGDFLVYFGGRFAYRVAHPNQRFHDDLRSQNLSEVNKHAIYEK